MDTLLEVKDLCIEFNIEEGRVRAVDHVSFNIVVGRSWVWWENRAQEKVWPLKLS